jgi:hypothetical protein
MTRPDDSVRFDFHHHVGAHKACHGNQCAGRPNLTEPLRMSPSDLLPVIDVRYEDAGAHDIPECRASRFKAGLDLAQCM